MANTVTGSTYAGDFAGQFVAAALLSAPTIEQGLITVLPNIHYKRVMKKISTTGNVLVNATCDFDHNMDVDVAERVLTLKEVQSNVQLCKKDYHQDWIAAQAGYSAYEDLPADFKSFMLAHVAGMAAASIETSIWEGASGTSGQFDGLVPLALADATVVDVASHAAVTAANVIDKLGSIIDSVPSTVYGASDLTLYVSRNIAKAYIRALGGFATGGLGANGVDGKGTTFFAGQNLSFDGIPVVVANGMADDTAMAAQTSNLFFGCGLLSDINAEAKYIDMSEIDGSQNCRIILRMSAGVQYAIGSDVVLYHA
jgi:hypothetical protein